MTTPGADDEFTELFDATMPRVDIVGKGASGVPRWLVMKQDAEFVRGLISKTSEEAPVLATYTENGRTVLPNGVHLSGSPAAMAAFIHASSIRKADEGESDPGDVAKAKNDTADREKKAASGAAMPDGSYPIADRADLGKAIHAVGRGGASHNAIRKHIISRARSLGASSEIPDNWNSDGSLKSGVTKEAGVPDKVTKDGAGDSFDDAVDDGQDGLDPTIPMAAPDDLDGIPGDPMDPGSAAWEAVDAATAVKWTLILAAAKRAVCWLMDRELLEAATVDPDDADNACDLASVLDALDYAIGVLAPFAVSEQSESDGMAAEVGKSAAGPSTVLEAVVAIAKAGRVLSSANEAKIRTAAQSLNDVLASLPQAPDAGGAAAVTKEGAMPETPTPAGVAKDAAAPDGGQGGDAGPVNAGGTTGLGEPRVTGPAESLPADGPQAALPGDVPGRTVVKSAIAAVFDQNGRLAGVRDPAAVVTRVEKADGEKQLQVVYDQNGNVVGVVDPAKIMPVAGAGAKAEAKPEEHAAPAAEPEAPAAPAAEPQPGPAAAAEPEAPAAPAAEPQPGPAAAAAPDDDDDMTPQPSADAGTPADEVGKGAAEDVITVNADALESAIAKAVAAAVGALTPAEDVAKGAVAGVSEEVEALKARLAVVEGHPAAPKVFTNGQVPPAHQMRGQDQGAALSGINVAKARERKQELYSADAPEQARIAKEMQQDAISVLSAMHSGR